MAKTPFRPSAKNDPKNEIQILKFHGRVFFEVVAEELQ